MSETPWSNESKTVVGFSKATGILLYGGFGIAGLVLGYFLPKIAAFVIQLPWVPFEGPLKLINSINGGWLNIALAILGLIAGLVLAWIAIHEMLIATITDKEVKLEKEGHQKTIAIRDIDTIFLDGKQLVILDKSGAELAREKIDESLKDIRAGFEKHNYPWSSEGDPFKDAYRRWVPDTPDISPSANALMKAREKALQDKNTADIKDLRNELAKLEIVVRDEETRQYWRLQQSK